MTRKSASRKQCKSNQVRNPSTGRCRKKISASKKSPIRKSPTRKSTSKKPCKSNQVRNPSTGRCRKKISASKKSSRKSPTKKPPSPQTPKKKSIYRKLTENEKEFLKKLYQDNLDYYTTKLDLIEMAAEQEYNIPDKYQRKASRVIDHIEGAKNMIEQIFEDTGDEFDRDEHYFDHGDIDYQDSRDVGLVFEEDGSNSFNEDFFEDEIYNIISIWLPNIVEKITNIRKKVEQPSPQTPSPQTKPPSPPSPQTPPPTKITVPELKKLAKDHNLYGYSKLNKQDLIDFLTKNNIVIE